MTRVAVLGLGLMGSELARNLLSKGNEVHGFNRTQEKAKPLIEKGLVPHSTPREAVENADVVITMLSDEDAVSEVAFGGNGFVDCMRLGSLWLGLHLWLPGLPWRCGNTPLRRWRNLVLLMQSITQPLALPMIQSGMKEAHKCSQRVADCLVLQSQKLAPSSRADSDSRNPF